MLGSQLTHPPTNRTVNEQMINRFNVLKTKWTTWVEWNTSSEEGAPYRESLMEDLPKEDLNFWHSINIPSPLMRPARLLQRLGFVGQPCSRSSHKLT